MGIVCFSSQRIPCLILAFRYVKSRSNRECMSMLWDISTHPLCNKLFSHIPNSFYNCILGVSHQTPHCIIFPSKCCTFSVSHVSAPLKPVSILLNNGKGMWPLLIESRPWKIPKKVSHLGFIQIKWITVLVNITHRYNNLTYMLVCIS